MKLLADTHVVIWWYLDSPDLPASFRTALERAETLNQRVGVSVFTLWEIAKPVELGRLKISLTVDDLLDQIETDRLREVASWCSPNLGASRPSWRSISRTQASI